MILLLHIKLDTLKGRRQAKKKRTTVPSMTTICRLPLVTAAGSCPCPAPAPAPWCWLVLPACVVICIVECQ